MRRPAKMPLKGGSSTKKKPCRYFARGHCKDGDKCKFLHEVADERWREEGMVSSSKSQSGHSSRSGPTENTSDSERMPRPCFICKDASAKLNKLRSQTESGLKLISKMESAFGELAQLARTNLEQTIGDVDEVINQIKTASLHNLVPKEKEGKTPATIPLRLDDKLAPVDLVRQESLQHDDERSRWGNIVSTDGNGSVPPCTAVDGTGNAVGSEDIIGEERRNDGYAGNSPANATFVDIVNEYAPFMTGSPQGYIASLCKEFNVEGFCPSDLVEIMDDCLDVLASISSGEASEEDVRFYDAVLGSVAKGVQEDFCNDLLTAAKAEQDMDIQGPKDQAKGRGSPTSAAIDLAESLGRCSKAAPKGHTAVPDAIDPNCFKGILSREEKANKVKPLSSWIDPSSRKVAKAVTIGKRSGKGHHPVSTENYASPRANTTAVGSISSSKQAAKTVTIVKKLKALPRKEYSLSTTRRDAPRVKPVAERGDQGESGEEEDNKARAEKKSQPNDPPKHNFDAKGEEQREKKRQNEADAWKKEKMNEYSSSYVEEAERLIWSQRQRSNISTANVHSTRSKEPCKEVSLIQGHQLPSYIKPFQGVDEDVSPIFRLLRNQETVLDGRELLRLEKEAKKQREVVAELERKRDYIAEYSVLAGDLTIKTKKEWDAKIAKRDRDVVNFDLRIAAVTRNVDETQDKIRCIAGVDGKSGNFNIDQRDERGHTILMHTAQVDDTVTANICLHMGANVHALSPEGLTALEYSYFFKNDNVTRLLLGHGGRLPSKQADVWNFLREVIPMKAESSHSWEETLKVSAIAAVPAEQYIKSPEKCEEGKKTRMEMLADDERQAIDFACFESRLINSSINPDQIRRVVLLNQSVKQWLSTSSNASVFARAIKGLLPSEVRPAAVNPTKCHRRAIVGTTATFEVLAAYLTPDDSDNVMIFSPFISGESEGVTQVGILVWAVAPDREASMYKTLIQNTEFMRHKSKTNDRFLPHKELCLELGKDMHLLDLHSTSIWTTSTMQLYTLNIDKDDLGRINDSSFTLHKRVVESEEVVNRALFGMSNDEMKKNDGILAAERKNMSSLIRGGAGVGKTLLLIRKVCHEDPSRRILVVSRLPRLVNAIKSAVEMKEVINDTAKNVKFVTYDKLLQLLAKKVMPDEESQRLTFTRFDQIHFDCDYDDGISFYQKFVCGYLNEKEKRRMKDAFVMPLSLWQAITTIKSHSRCAMTKKPLTFDEYMALPSRFGLKEDQRRVCYNLFNTYEAWRESGAFWDESDRTMYVLKNGPSVFRDADFIPWYERVYRRGEMDLLDKDGSPQEPFFFDSVFADEAQDFTALDQALLIRMSNIRSVFLNIDPAQSVEQGVKMNAKGISDVFYSQICEKSTRVDDILQRISLKTNHRTHAENMRLASAIRSLLSRSFGIPVFDERALIRGKLPKTLHMTKMSDLTTSFRGANCVFIAPEEMLPALRLRFQEIGVQNDLFGVREAKGLEFDSVALIGFFEYIQKRGSCEAWKNALRWLSSTSGISETRPTGEKICGTLLEDCDYRISHPEVSDEAMLLYTALTRARNQLYLIETDSAIRASKAGEGGDLAAFAFWRLHDLGLAKAVDCIDEGLEEMTPAQQKARGVLLVMQALSMIQSHEPFDLVRKKFLDAADRFGPTKGNDRPLLEQCTRHLNALEAKRELMQYAKKEFYSGNGKYSLEGRFAEVLCFEQKLSSFFSAYLGDSYIVDEVKEIQCLVGEIFFGTPYYELRFKHVFKKIEELVQFV